MWLFSQHGFFSVTRSAVEPEKFQVRARIHRDWIFARDHANGILMAGEQGKPGEAYNVGGGNERPNRDVTYRILELLSKPESLIHHVADRPGHDRRYALDCTKLQNMGWAPQHTFEEALRETVKWFQAHEDWWRPIKDGGDYQDYYRRNYAQRLAQSGAKK